MAVSWAVISLGIWPVVLDVQGTAMCLCVCVCGPRTFAVLVPWPLNRNILDESVRSSFLGESEVFERFHSYGS